MTLSKTKKISILVIAFIAVVFCIHYFIKLDKEQKTNLVYQNYLKNLHTQYEISLYDEKEIASMIYENIIKNTEILQILEDINKSENKNKLNLLRDRLHSLVQKDYDMYKNMNISQIHFVLPNNHSFLRMHKPEKYGDDLTNIRPDFAYVNKTKTEINGFHRGKTNPAFGNVKPIFGKNNKYLGCLDIGFDTSILQDRLTNINKNTTHIIINKNVFSVKSWNKNGANDIYMVSAENDNYNVKLSKLFNKQLHEEYAKNIKNVKDEISNKLKHNMPFTIEQQLNNQNALMIFYPIKNAVSKEVNAWLVLNIEHEELLVKVELEHEIVFIVFVFLLLVLFILLYKFLKHKEDLDEQIFLQTNSLKLANNELNKLNEIMQNKSDEINFLLEQYKYVVDTAMIVSKADLKGNITFVNDLFCELSGYSETELVGKSHNIVRDDSNDKSLYIDLWNTIKNKKIWTGTFPNKAKDGTKYYVKSTVAPLLNKNGDIIEYMAIRQDITEQIHLEHEAKKALLRTQHILDSQESMIVISSTTELVEANKRLFELSGFNNLDEFKKVHACVCELFIEKEGYLKTSTKEYKWIEPISKEPNKMHKAMIKAQDGKIVIFDVKMKKIYLDDEEYLIFTFSDITDVEKLKEEAIASQQAKSDFLSNMSHEIRTPMNGMSGFLQLLEKTHLTTTQEKYLSIVQTSMKTLLQIINDILDFSKLEGGHMSSEFLEVNPYDELHKSFLNFSAKAQEKNINYIIGIKDNLYDCYFMDQLHINQVMQNLINNAIKFTKEDGTVRVCIEKIAQYNKEYDEIKFSVKDDGIGIAKENHAKVLDAFSQADSSTTRKFGGTGLGLSICKSLVNLMGGELQLDSDIGKGSNFYFTLKLKKCENYVKTNEKLLKKIICIFDKNDEDYKSVQEQLKNFNLIHEYFTLNKFTQIKENKNYYHIIITNNEECAKKLANEHSKNIKIILLNHNNVDVKNIQTIPNYDSCSSKMFNILLQHDVIETKSDFQDSTIYNKINILVAEDYEINRILLEDIFKTYNNIDYKFVENGQEAVDILLEESYKFDFVFMDINMPILDGVEATKILRNNDIQIPIIALTANALEGDKDMLLNIGMDSYVTKPIDIEELDKIIKYYASLNNKKLNAENKKENLHEIDILNNDDISNKINETMKKMKFPKKVVMKLLTTYVNSSNSLLNKYEDGLNNSDLSLIAKATHDIKSASLTLNFEDIGNLAKDIEYKSLRNEEADYIKAFAAFKDHYKAIEIYLNNIEI